MNDRRVIPMAALQRADKFLGAICCALLQPLRWARLGRRPPELPGRHKVLCMKFWGIGSLQMLTPAARSLRANHPGAELVFLTLASNRQCAEGLGVFDRVLTLEVAGGGWLRVFGRILALVRALRSERFTAVYDFEFFTRFSAVVGFLTGAPHRHGFASTLVWRGGLHTHEVPFNRYWHVARNFRVLAGVEDGLNVTASDLVPHRVTELDELRIEELLSAAGLAPGTEYAVLNPNAGTLSLERRWPAQMFADLAGRLLQEDALPVVLIGSGSEHEYTEGVLQLIETPAPVRALNLAGAMTTGELAAVLRGAAIVLSNDSGPMHLAAALGAPTVGLFGPETPVMYGPIGLRALALYRPPACSPCINVHDNKVASCIYGRPECLVNLPVDEVLEALRALRRGDVFEPPSATVEPTTDDRPAEPR